MAGILMAILMAMGVGFGQAEPAAKVPIPDRTEASTPRAALDATLSVELAQPAMAPGTFAVEGDWAFFSGDTPVAPDGRALDWSRTGYAPDPSMDDATFALLRRVEGRWTVVAHDLMCNDVCWEDYPERFPQAPAAIFR